MPLQLNEVDVAVDRAGTGGGLTSVGDELLLLAHDGALFVVQDSEIIRAHILPPDNGFEQYRIAAEGKYSHLSHELGEVRFNDILYLDSAKGPVLVVSYTEWIDEQECYGTALARLDLPQAFESIVEVHADSDDWEIVFRTKPCLPLKDHYRAIEGHMAGGRLALLESSTIVLGSGDYAWDGMYAPRAYSQDPGSDYGKIIAINVDDGTSEVLAMGTRNVQGILVDSSGDIWAVEHGPRGGDELNKIVRGENYGWPLKTLGTRYNKLPVPSAKDYGRHPDPGAPVFAWLPSIGVSNIARIENFDPSWDGDLLVASLKAKTLFRLRLKNDQVVFVEPIVVGKQIRYVHQHTDGKIVLWTDSRTLISLERSSKLPVELFLEEAMASLDLEIEQLDKLRSVIDSCSECHAFSLHDHQSAPSLGGVFDRPIASTSYGGYSNALRAKTGVWTAEQLKLFLEGPNSYAPGTTMPNTDLSSEMVAATVELLRALADPE